MLTSLNTSSPANIRYFAAGDTLRSAGPDNQRCPPPRPLPGFLAHRRYVPLEWPVQDRYTSSRCVFAVQIHSSACSIWSCHQ
jgi:hypothetical protein